MLIGWAITSCSCHWCMEKELARLLRPSLNKRTGDHQVLLPPDRGTLT